MSTHLKDGSESGSGFVVLIKAGGREFVAVGDYGPALFLDKDEAKVLADELDDGVTESRVVPATWEIKVKE